MKQAIYVILMGLVIALIFCVPLLQIWAINTLFPVATIPYTFGTYFATMVLNATFFYKPSTQNVKITGK